MNLHYLHEFVLLAQTLNYHVAAKELFIAQPSLSKHITAIESEIGVKLFFRDKNHVRLTDSGKIFLEGAVAVLDTYEAAVRRAQETDISPNGTIRIGYIYGFSSNLLRQIVDSYKVHYPNTTVLLEDYRLYELNDAFAKKKIDFGLSIETISDFSEEYEITRLYKEPYCVVVRRDHPFASMESVDPDLLLHEPLILPDPMTTKKLYDTLMGWFCGKVPKNVTGYFYDLRGLLLDIEIGQGIGIMRGAMQKDFSRDLVFVPIQDDGENWAVYIIAVWKKSLKEATVNSFRKVLSEISTP